MATTIELLINGQVRRTSVEPRQTLLEVLRENLGLTGTKCGCDEGDCGACIVLIDIKPVNSCLVLAVEVQGRGILAIEGLGSDGLLDPVQQAFVDNGAIRCGFCTPGMVITAKGLLAEKPRPSESEIRAYMQGNLCRCTGFSKIVDAVLAVARSNGAHAD
jgi:carbon-monoxide dehydrogenase small subunit